MVALILADGDVPARSDLDLAWPAWDEAVEVVIAADGGARHASGLGVAIDLWVGDGDSIGEDALAALEAAGVPLERSPQDKDESDTELAIRAALRLGQDGVIILGALGGRIDHALANIGLLAMPELVGREAVILDARSRTVLIRAPGPDGSRRRPARCRAAPATSCRSCRSAPGVDGVTTRGLAYPLVDEPLPVGRARGTVERPLGARRGGDRPARPAARRGVACYA